MLFGFSSAVAQRLPVFSPTHGGAVPGAPVRAHADRGRRPRRALPPAGRRRHPVRASLVSPDGRPPPARPQRPARRRPRRAHRPAGLGRGRALPPHLHDPAAVERRDAAAGARAVAPLDELEPARPGRLRGARPRRVPVRDPAAPRRGLERARDRHGAGGRGLHPQRDRPARRVAAARGARPAPALVRRRAGHDGGAAGERVRPRRPGPDARRLPDRVEQAAAAAARRGLAARWTAIPTRRSSPPRSAGPRTTGSSSPRPGATRPRIGWRRSPGGGSTCASGCSAAPRSATRG